MQKIVNSCAATKPMGVRGYLPTALAKIMAVAMFVVVGVHSAAIEEVLIDFSLLVPNVPPESPIHESSTLLTYGDLYSTATGVSISDEERELVRSSLAIPQWRLTLNSSARDTSRILSSSIRVATVSDSASENAGEGVLGVRVNFAEGDTHSWALIEPAYRIPRVPLHLITGRDVDFSQRVVINDVAQIRSISVEVYGLNYPHRLSVLYEDTDGRLREFFIGTLDFTGWRTITWDSQYYVPAEVEVPVEVPPEVGEEGAEIDGALAAAADADAEADATTVALQRLEPLYPQTFNNIAFRGIRIWKNGSNLTGDFVGYIKEVRVDYDPQPTSVLADIDHEGLWGIISDGIRRQNRIRQLQAGPGAIYESIRSNANNDGVVERAGANNASAPNNAGAVDAGAGQ